MTVPMNGSQRRLRCAIYTRKSTENGLEQEFNSLDNQREAAEAFIKSQAHKGWRLLPQAYDDGGFSGGSLDRPALRQLLEDVRAGRVDVIVVYKVDRLTRSLSDFAKLVELFDRHGVSFVSVTQAFNTTNSMGRLTLNVLLSFAQFEREVTAERIRDKIAASKKKGMRVGGPVPLGYLARDKKLVADPEEAERVRGIFSRYLELGCLGALVTDLRQRGIVTKISQRRNGGKRGGGAFAKGSLAYLLHNRVYVGEIIHKGRYYQGAHKPIVSADLFEAVQTAMAAKAPDDRVNRVKQTAPLAGLLYDEHGRPMLPTTAKKGALRYRYYASRRDAEAGTVAARELARSEPISRVNAPELERRVVAAIGLPSDEIDPDSASMSARSRLVRIDLYSDRMILRLRAPNGSDQPDHDDADATKTPIGETRTIPWSAKARHKRREVIELPGDDQQFVCMRSETRARLLEGIAKARSWLDELLSGRVEDTLAISHRESCSERSVRMTLNLAFLSPTIVQAALAGTLPDTMGISVLTAAPMDWNQQFTRM